MRKGITESGFEYEIDEHVLDDMRILDDIEAVSSGSDPTAIASLVNKMLGNDQKQRLYKHLETEDGRVPIKAMSDEITAIFKGMGTEGKNS